MVHKLSNLQLTTANCIEQKRPIDRGQKKSLRRDFPPRNHRCSAHKDKHFLLSWDRFSPKQLAHKKPSNFFIRASDGGEYSHKSWRRRRREMKEENWKSSLLITFFVVEAPRELSPRKYRIYSRFNQISRLRRLSAFCHNVSEMFHFVLLPLQFWFPLNASIACMSTSSFPFLRSFGLFSRRN